MTEGLRIKFTSEEANVMYDKIAVMTEAELFDYVMVHPMFVADRYYADFGGAIRQRHSELQSERFDNKVNPEQERQAADRLGAALAPIFK